MTMKTETEDTNIICKSHNNMLNVELIVDPNCHHHRRHHHHYPRNEKCNIHLGYIWLVYPYPFIRPSIYSLIHALVYPSDREWILFEELLETWNETQSIDFLTSEMTLNGQPGQVAEPWHAEEEGTLQDHRGVTPTRAFDQNVFVGVLQIEG